MENDWDAQEDSDDELEEEDYTNSKEALLFIIEATPSMLSPTLDPNLTNSTPSSTQAQAVSFKSVNGARSKMEVCLRTVYALMRRKVISSPKDLCGVLIFNTMDSTKVGDLALNNMILLYDLQQLTVQIISSLKGQLTESEQDPDYLSQLLHPLPSDSTLIGKGIPGITNLNGALDAAGALFAARAMKLTSKRIILITDNDDPLKGNSLLAGSIRYRREDLGDAGVIIETYFIPPTKDHTFDLDNFYGDLIASVDIDGNCKYEYPEVEDDLNTSLDQMISNMRSREAMKRVAFSCPFFLAEKTVIGIKGYVLVNETKKRDPVRVDNTTNDEGVEVYSKTIYKDMDSGAALDPQIETKKYFQFGEFVPGKDVEPVKILLEPLDIKKIKSLGTPPGLKLLGFEPSSSGLKFQDFVKHSYFIYPDEDKYTGSVVTFASLLHNMLEKDVIGFGWLLARSSARPQIVLLLPQAQSIGIPGKSDRPNGIHLIQLPFVDDMRGHRAGAVHSIVTEGGNDCPPVDVVRRMVKNYNAKKFTPDQFPNPALNHFYDTIAAFALDDKLPEPEDKTIPNFKRIDAVLGDSLEEMRSLIKVDAIDVSTLPMAPKRKTIAVDPNAPPPNLEDFIEEYQEKGVKITNDKIKAALKLMGLSTTGVKDVLLKRALEYLTSKGLMNANDSGDEEDEKKPKKKKKSKAKKEQEEEEAEDSDIVFVEHEESD